MKRASYLTEIRVKGYKSLVDVQLELRDLMVLIGPNGSGKSALLESFILLQHAMDKQLAKRIQDLGGIQSILSRNLTSPEVMLFGIKAKLEDGFAAGTVNYGFELEPDLVGYVVSSENLAWTKSGEQKAGRYIDVKDNHTKAATGMPGAKLSNIKLDNRAEVAFSQIRRVGPILLMPSRLLKSILSYSTLDISQRAVVRLAQPLTPEKMPGPNGENLFSALYNARTNEPSTYERIIEVLKLGFSRFQKLEFPVVGAGQVTLAWYQNDLSGPLYPNQLSEGTLRFLWLVTILVSAELPSVLVIDEPEVSLHPELLKLFAGLIQDASARCQLIVATHSSDFIRWLEPNEIVVTDKTEDGATQFSWADSLNLDAWLDEYTLADLWRMGTLGVRP